MTEAYLFCFRKDPGMKHAVNQRRHTTKCRKLECEFLIDIETPDCSCKPDPSYFLAFDQKSNKKRKQEKEEEENNEEV